MRVVVLGMGVLQLRQTIRKARLNDCLTLAARHVGLDDWLLVLRRRTTDDQLATALGIQLGAPVPVRILPLLILLTLILTV